jgi:hypothetical protein
MKPLACSFVALHLLLTGCIISYDFPKVTPPFLSKKASLPCYVSNPEDPYDSDHKKMLQAMAQVGISSMETASHTLPQNGRYCSIQIREEMGQPGTLAVLTLVLPAYEGVQYTIEYEVYENRARLKSYQYDFKKEAWVWGPLLVVFWVNWLNTSKQDAFTATLVQFMQDAQRDGYL